MDIASMIKASADKLDAKRKAIELNSGYVVQYTPCGHFRAVEPDEPLVEKCKKWMQMHEDALILSSGSCPICLRKIVDSYL